MNGGHTVAKAVGGVEVCLDKSLDEAIDGFVKGIHSKYMLGDNDTQR